MTKEALKLALEALTIQSDRVTEIGKQREAITAIEEALAQPEQEPVAWEQFHEHMAGSFYKPPPQRPWVGLTEAERIDTIDEEITAQGIEHFALAQAIEAKLKEKNT